MHRARVIQWKCRVLYQACGVKFTVVPSVLPPLEAEEEIVEIVEEV